MKKKINLFSVTCMAIGTIVGAGVFGTIPSAASMVGNGIEWAYIIALLSIILCYLPQLVTISVLPAPFTVYMHSTRMVSPVIGYIQVIYGFNYVFILAAVTRTFAQYAAVYIPIDQRILGIMALLIFAFITGRGVETNTRVQNFMVVCLFISLAMYIVLGMPHLDGNLVSIASVAAPKNMSIVALGSAVALLSSSLQGGISIAFYPDEIKNPGRNVPLGFILSTGICCFTFMLVSIITIGVIPLDQVDSLLDVAKLVLTKPQYHFFICAGAIFATLSSLNGIFVAGGHVGSAVAEDKVVTDWFGKLNKNQVPSNTVWLLAIVSAVLVGFGFNIGTLLTAYSLLNLFCLLVLFIPANKVHKLYPHTFKHASFTMNPRITMVMSIFGVVFCIWQIISTCITLNRGMIITIIVWYVAWYAFYFYRRASLKKKGFDLNKQMSEPYASWVETEAKYAAQDAKEE